jgi:protein-S-isoprenylcysteine O-methyltransferase Ste14
VALREEFERAGNWCFRHRGVLPLLLLPPIAVAMRGYTYPRGSPSLNLAWQAACLAIGLTGVALRAVTVGYAARGTSGRNRASQVAESLNTTGVYSVLRHPLYLGNFLMWLSVAAVPRVWWLPIFFTLTFWLYYERIMFAEEAFLHRKFGEAFSRWAAATPAIIPRPSQWRRPQGEFSLRAVLRREYSGLLLLVLCFAALDVLGDLMHYGHLVLDPVWLIAVAAVGVLTAVLRFLRHRTRVLHRDA